MMRRYSERKLLCSIQACAKPRLDFWSASARPLSSSAPTCCSTCSSGGTGVNPLQTVELKTYDWRLTRTARPETARQDIVLVEIDEFSIRNLQPYAGRWPWPRVVHSMLLDYLSRAPAKVIVYDVNFAEPDGQGSFEFGTQRCLARNQISTSRIPSRPPAT